MQSFENFEKLFWKTLPRKKQILLQIWTVQNSCKVTYGLIEKTFWALHAAHWGRNTSLSRLNLAYSTVDTLTLQPFDVFGCCIQFATSRWSITSAFCEWSRNFVTNAILLHTSVLCVSHIASSVADSCIICRTVRHVWASFVVFTLHGLVWLPCVWSCCVPGKLCGVVVGNIEGVTMVLLFCVFSNSA